LYYLLRYIFINADNNIIIPQAHKGVPYRIRVHLIKLWAFEDGKKAYFRKPSQN